MRAFFEGILIGLAGAFGAFFGWIRRNPFWAIFTIGFLIIAFFYTITFVVTTLHARDDFGRANEGVQEGFWRGTWLKWRPTIFDGSVIDDKDAGGDSSDNYDSNDDGNVDDGGDDSSDTSACSEQHHTPQKGVTWNLTGPASAEIWTNEPKKSAWGREYGQDLHKVLVPDGKTVRIPSGGGTKYTCRTEEEAKSLYDDNSYPPGDIDLIN